MPLPSYKMEPKKAGTYTIIVLGAAGLINLLSGGANLAKADPNTGYMIIVNYLDGINVSNRLSIGHLSDSVTDGYDPGFDTSFLYPMPWECGLYSDISDIDPNHPKLAWDYRLPSSKKDFLIQLVYNGTLGSPKENHLNFELYPDPNWQFGNKPMIFDSNRLPYGPVVDMRKAIALAPNPNDVNIPLIDVPAGTYSHSTPYGSGTLSIGTRLLADLNNDKTVNFVDFALFANDWKNHSKENPKTKCIGNLSGQYGIPDGNDKGKAIVNEIDLGAFCEQWLDDPNIW